MSTNFILLTPFNFNEFRPHFYLLVDKQQICYLFFIHLFPYFILLSTAILIFFSRTTRTIFSSIYSIYYIIITIVITLFTRLITVFIYGIIGTISIIFFCDLQTNYKHCLHLLFQPTFIIFYLINFFSKQYGTTLCFKVFDKISSPFFD